MPSWRAHLSWVRVEIILIVCSCFKAVVIFHVLIALVFVAVLFTAIFSFLVLLLLFTYLVTHSASTGTSMRTSIAVRPLYTTSHGTIRQYWVRSLHKHVETIFRLAGFLYVDSVSQLRNPCPQGNIRVLYTRSPALLPLPQTRGNQPTFRSEKL